MRLFNRDLVDPILEGLLEANTRHIDWSGGRSLHDAGLELFASTVIAGKLIEHLRGKGLMARVTLETQFKDFARLSFDGLSGKPDILLHNEEEDQFGIVEVKKWPHQSIEQDARRILKAFCGFSGVSFGCIAWLNMDYEADRRSKCSTPLQEEASRQLRGLLAELSPEYDHAGLAAQGIVSNFWCKKGTAPDIPSPKRQKPGAVKGKTVAVRALAIYFERSGS